MNEDPFARANQEELSLSPTESLPDDLWKEIDDALGDVLTPVVEDDAGPPALEAEPINGFSHDPALRQMQELFLAMSRNSLNPVARYMKAISQGEDARTLLEITELVVTPLIPKVEEVGLQDHAEELSFFRSLLLLALGERDQTGTKAMREVVMEGFEKLSVRYELNYRGYRLAVRNLVEFYRALRASDSVSEMDVRRFFAIGVPSLTWVRRTKVAEMTSLSGIAPQVMTQIRELAYRHRSVSPMTSARLADEEMPKLRREPSVLDLPITESEYISDTAFENLTDDAIAAVRGQA